jgi:hypothetical protein
LRKKRCMVGWARKAEIKPNSTGPDPRWHWRFIVEYAFMFRRCKEEMRQH